MIAVQEAQIEFLARGRWLKYRNMLVAACCGLVSTAAWVYWFPGQPERYLIGFVIGILWSNALEYLYHRYLMHVPNGVFTRSHQLHHSTFRSPAELEHLSFGASPWLIVLLYLLNFAPLVILDWELSQDIAPVFFLAAVLYFIAGEEIHWRMHRGEWLPALLQRARRHHLEHHESSSSRFDLFLPLFDWLLGTRRSRIQPSRSRARSLEEAN